MKNKRKNKMKNKKILSMILVSALITSNVPLFAAKVTKPVPVSSIFSNIWSTIKNQVTAIKNNPEFISLARKARTWSNSKLGLAKTFWSKSDSLHKTMYGSVAVATVVASPLLLFSKVRKTLACLTLLAAGTGTTYYVGAKTEFGKETLKNLRDGAVKAYKAIVKWGKEELESINPSGK